MAPLFTIIVKGWWKLPRNKHRKVVAPSGDKRDSRFLARQASATAFRLRSGSRRLVIEKRAIDIEGNQANLPSSNCTVMCRLQAIGHKYRCPGGHPGA